MGAFMKDNFKTICFMDRVIRNGKTAQVIQVITHKEWRLVMVYINGPMVNNIMECGLTTKNMGKGKYMMQMVSVNMVYGIMANEYSKLIVYQIV